MVIRFSPEKVTDSDRSHFDPWVPIIRIPLRTLGVPLAVLSDYMYGEPEVDWKRGEVIYICWRIRRDRTVFWVWSSRRPRDLSSEPQSALTPSIITMMDDEKRHL